MMSPSHGPKSMTVKVGTLTLIDRKNSKHGLSVTLLLFAVAIQTNSSWLWAQTDTTETSLENQALISSPDLVTPIASCQSIKELNRPVWPVNENNSLNDNTIVTRPYTNPRGLTGSRYSATAKQNVEIEWITIQRNAQLATMQIETRIAEQAHSQWVLDENCQPLQHRRIVYNNGMAKEIQIIDPTSETDINSEALNPALPEINVTSENTNRIRVGMIDSGVNYTLSQINERLARDQDGELIGYDFWENDNLPFDVHFSFSPFRIVRHGTGTASLLLQEAPFVDLVPYRYPRPDMTRMQDLIEHAATNQVYIIGIPLGGNDVDEWNSFVMAAKQHPDILFIASAGNNGRNIDQQPVYPASLDIDNLLVVTSADDFIVPAERVNWGRTTVDYMLPAEEQPIINFRGEKTTASGSSYAVPRAVALAAKFLKRNPDWRAPELIKEFARRFADGSSFRYVGGGFIADPLAEDNLEVKLVSEQELTHNNSTQVENDKPVYKLPLNVYVLHEGWPIEMVSASMREAETILAQCNIAFNAVSISELSIPAYLRDLDAGTAKTLVSELENNAEFRPIKVFYARDTRMLTPFDGEAFGRGNTRRRPWMQDSVWLMSGIDDAGIALAHELFHVLTNSGEHNQIANNLMQTRTSQGRTVLEPMQCEAAIRTAKGNQLLFD